MGKLQKIDIQIPSLSETNLTDNKYLTELFSQLSNFKVTGYLQTNLSESLFPQTRISPSPISSPQISFITDNSSETDLWHAGELTFGFNLLEQKQVRKEKTGFEEEVLSDQVGEYTKLSNQNDKFYVLTIKQLLDRFNGKLIELNHSGMNFGPKLIKNQDYVMFRDKLAKTCNMYKYPTGEEWPFIVPATKEEFQSEIKDDTQDRNPKFELVFSEYHPKPVIQFDIETSLSKEEVFNLLPEPYGVSFEGLENFIRTVFIHIDWGNTILRFDLRFKSKDKDFGYWLVKEGGRYL